MSLLKSLKKVHIFLLLVIVSSFFIIHMAKAVTAEPGTDADPLVTQSYVDAKISSLTTQIDSLKQQSLQNAQYSKFTILEGIEPGKQVIAGESTEIILRSGKAKAIASENGGLSDIISGVDIQEGSDVPTNHLLVIPRNDGRGLKVTEKAWIMIKGPYTIK